MSSDASHERTGPPAPAAADSESDETANRVGRRRLLAGTAALGGLGVMGGAAWVGAALAGVDVPMGARVRRRIGGACGDDPGAPDVQPGPLRSGLMDDSWMGEPTRWHVSYPPGTEPGDEMPVVLVLHGAQGTAIHAFEDGHGLDRFQAVHVTETGRPYALAAVDGHLSFWYDRPDGPRPIAMVLEAFIPMLAEMGLDTSSLPIHGWGSGATAAMIVALELGSDVVGPVGALSPALFDSFDDAAAVTDNFDTADGFHVWDLHARLDELARLDLMLDCGADDPFAAPVGRLRDALTSISGEAPPGSIGEGCRTRGYWHRRHPVHLRHAIV